MNLRLVKVIGVFICGKPAVFQTFRENLCKNVTNVCQIADVLDLCFQGQTFEMLLYVLLYMCTLVEELMYSNFSQIGGVLNPHN